MTTAAPPCPAADGACPRRARPGRLAGTTLASPASRRSWARCSSPASRRGPHARGHALTALGGDVPPRRTRPRRAPGAVDHDVRDARAPAGGRPSPREARPPAPSKVDTPRHETAGAVGEEATGRLRRRRRTGRAPLVRELLRAFPLASSADPAQSPRRSIGGARRGRHARRRRASPPPTWRARRAQRSGGCAARSPSCARRTFVARGPSRGSPEATLRESRRRATQEGVRGGVCALGGPSEGRETGVLHARGGTAARRASRELSARRERATDEREVLVAVERAVPGGHEGERPSGASQSRTSIRRRARRRARTPATARGRRAASSTAMPARRRRAEMPGRGHVRAKPRHRWLKRERRRPVHHRNECECAKRSGALVWRSVT